MLPGETVTLSGDSGVRVKLTTFNVNGALAVRLAQDACRQTQFGYPVFIGTLAAAYAEDGRFDDAISTARRACLLASRQGDSALFQKNEELLALYLKHQPFHFDSTNSVH